MKCSFGKKPRNQVSNQKYAQTYNNSYSFKQKQREKKDFLFISSPLFSKEEGFW